MIISYLLPIPMGFQEIRENRHFDRWIVNLADFFQTEKYQLLKLGALNNNDFSQLVLSASRNLAEDDFNKSVAIMSQLIERTQKWQSENVISFDGTNQSAWQRVNEKIAERYADTAIKPI